MPTPEVERMLGRAEEVLARHGGTAEARAASMRTVGRTARDIGTRLKRSVAAMSATGIGLAGVGLATTGVVGVELLIAGIFAVPAMGAAAALLPTRRAVEVKKLGEVPLNRLAADAEEWLAAAQKHLPRTASAHADAIRNRLAELQPQLAEKAPGDAEAVEARRLIADHLPRLVHAWIAVPPAHRANAPEVEGELVNGLRIVSGELTRLSQAMAAVKLDRLKIERGFLEARYKEGGPAGA